MTPLACALLSGAAGLMYQVIWNRDLLLLFGSTSAAAASVIAAFMAGMSMGAWAIVRLRGKWRWPSLMIYAILELGIAGYALLFHPLLMALQSLYPALWNAALGQPVGLNLMRLGLGLVMLVVPTVAMGATVPLLVDAMRRDRSYASRSVGWIYGLNAGGGAVGAALSGLILLPWLGLQRALLVGVALSGLAALLGLAASRRRRVSSAASLPQTTNLDGPHYRAVGPGSRRLFLLALLGTGFASMGYEVLWTRMLVLISGSSTYAFSLMLALYIGGVAIGSLWLAKKIMHLKAPGDAFGHLQIGAGLLVVAGLWLFGHFPDWQLGLYRTWGTAFDTTLMVDAILATIIIVPPTILLGAAFPVAAEILGNREDHMSGTSITLAVLALGNAAGALSAGTFLVPWLGLEGALAALVAVTFICGFLVPFTDYGSVSGRRLTAAAGIVLVLTGPLAIPHWNPLLLTSGVYERAPVYLDLLGNSVRLGNLLKTYRLLDFEAGNQAVVSVIRFPTLKTRPHLALSIDGKVDASTGKDMSTQILSGHLGMLLRPQAHNVLVIGLASGVTVGSVEQWPGVRHLTVAEISPAVVRSKRWFAPYNHHAMQDPRVHLVVDDGRHYLLVTRQHFQVVISEPSNPWLSGPARLFTRQFFLEVRNHLSPRGVLVQWLPLYGLSTALLKAEARTFLSVFPHVAMLRVSAGDLVLVGGRQPLMPDIEAKLPRSVLSDLARIHYDRWRLLADFVTADEGLRRWAGIGPLNTDGNGLLEFGAPRYLLVPTLKANVESVYTAPWRKALVRWTRGAPLEIARSYFNGNEIGRADYLAKTAPPGPNKWLLLGDIAAREGNWITASQLWRRVNTPQAREKVAYLTFTDEQPWRGLRILAEVPVFARGQYYYYLRMLLEWQANHRSAAAAAAAHLRVGAEPRQGWEILSTYLKTLLLRQAWPSDGTAAVPVSTAGFQRLLDELRRALERERGESILDSLLRRIRDLPPGLLTKSEYQDLERTISKRVLRPLTIYDRGVSLFFMGRFSGAEQAFQFYLKALPANSGPSYAQVMLSRLHALRNSRPAPSAGGPKSVIWWQELMWSVYR